MSRADDEGERVVAQFGTLFVTESRVREDGADGLKSAFLHEVNAAGTRRIHYPWLLAVAAVGGVLIAAGMFGRDSAALIGIGALVAVVAGLAYALTREVTLVVCAGNMTMSATVRGSTTPMGQSGRAVAVGADAFVEALEEAKLAWEAQSRR